MATLGLSGSIAIVPISIAAEDGVPGVLRFAQKYRAEELKNKNQTSDGKDDTSLGASKPVPPETVTTEREEHSGQPLVLSSELKRRLAISEREITQLKKENSRLRSQPKPNTTKEEIALRDKVLGLNKQLKAVQTEHQLALSSFAEQVQSERNELESKVLSLTKKVGELETTNATLRTANKKDIDALKLVGEKNKPLNEKIKSLETEIARLKTLQKSMPVVSAESLSAPELQQAYAAGVMLGRDVLTMQQGQALLGLKVDNRVLLAGLRDALHSQVLLNSEALQRALTMAEEKAQKSQQQIAAQQKKLGETYLSTFKQNKGVKQDPMGFWYRIEYLGDGEMIKDDNAVVDVVVVEKLTDGSVVEDMDIKGIVISQPLSEYPVLFRTALTRLKNHGTMTLVVPSSLAYGDEGYPPKVPPGASLVYTLRVEQVNGSPQPENKKRSAKVAKNEVANAN